MKRYSSDKSFLMGSTTMKQITIPFYLNYLNYIFLGLSIISLMYIFKFAQQQRPTAMRVSIFMAVLLLALYYGDVVYKMDGVTMKIKNLYHKVKGMIT